MAAESLLAESNPGNPDRSSDDAIYDLSLQHLESDRNFLNTANPALQRLIIDQVQAPAPPWWPCRGRPVRAGRAQRMAGRLGKDDLQTLTLAVEVAIAMQLNGRAADARRLILEYAAPAGASAMATA